MLSNLTNREERSASPIEPRNTQYSVQSGSIARIPAHPKRTKLNVYNMSSQYNLRYRWGDRPTTTYGAPIYLNGGEEFRANTQDLYVTNDSAAGSTAITIEVYEEFEA